MPFYPDPFHWADSEVPETENDLLGVFIDSHEVPAGWCGVVDLEAGRAVFS